MGFELNEKLRGLQPYDPIAGEYPIRLDANESFLPTTPQEQEALQQALQTVNLRRYPDPKAKRLCAAAAGYYTVDPASLTAWNGLDECLMVLSTAFLGQGQSVMLLDPDFSMYAFYAHMAEGTVLSVPKRKDFAVDVDDLCGRIQEHNPAMLLFSNPCNPTSLVLPPHAIEPIVQAGQKANTLVVVDEAYMEFSEHSVRHMVKPYNNLVVLRTCSKAVGLAGLRLGFSITNPALSAVLQSAKSPYNVGALTQALGEAVLRNPAALHEGVAVMVQAREALAKGLRALGLPVVGKAANFVFVRDTALYYEPLCAQGIVTRKVGAHLRITVGAPHENEALLAAWQGILSTAATSTKEAT